MSDDWRDLLIADLRTAGVVRSRCLGCGKFDCTGCPCGSGDAIDLEALAPAAANSLRMLYRRRKVLAVPEAVGKDAFGRPMPMSMTDFSCGCPVDVPSVGRCDGLWIRCNERLADLHLWQSARLKQNAG